MINFKSREEYLAKVTEVEALPEDKVLTYEEAYVFSMAHYEVGGDQFIECCDPAEYDELVESLYGNKFRRWPNTKKELREQQSMWADHMSDILGW